MVSILTKHRQPYLPHLPLYRARTLLLVLLSVHQCIKWGTLLWRSQIPRQRQQSYRGYRNHDTQDEANEEVEHAAPTLA